MSIPKSLRFEEDLNAIQTCGSKFSPVPRIRLNTTNLVHIKVEVSILNKITYEIVPNAVVKADTPLIIRVDEIEFDNIKIRSIPFPSGEYLLRISIGGTVTHSNSFQIN